MFIKLTKDDNTPLLLNKKNIISVGIRHYNRGGYEVRVETPSTTYSVLNSFDEIHQLLQPGLVNI